MSEATREEIGLPEDVLYWGDNGNHEFWENGAHTLGVLRNHLEGWWTAHRNHGYVGSANSAREAAEILGADLSEEFLWERASAGFALRRRKPQESALVQA